jgi:hypothetical protein
MQNSTCSASDLLVIAIAMQQLPSSEDRKCLGAEERECTTVVSEQNLKYQVEVSEVWKEGVTVVQVALMGRSNDSVRGPPDGV